MRRGRRGEEEEEGEEGEEEEEEERKEGREGGRKGRLTERGGESTMKALLVSFSQTGWRKASG